MTRAIIITGASSGIGRATAELFLARGWLVGLVARRRDRLEEVAAGNPRAVVLPADVTDPAQVARAFDAFDERAPRLDVLFNNAGIFTPAAVIDEVRLEDWTASVDVNLTAMFLCAREAFGRMRRQSPEGGRIINNGSISAHAPRPGAVAYTATKHAITGLTRAISLDGRPFDISCGQIDVGNARTDLLEELARQARASGEPEPAMIDVALVAKAVLDMAELPPEANILEMTLMANRMPYVGRG